MITSSTFFFFFGLLLTFSSLDGILFCLFLSNLLVHLFRTHGFIAWKHSLALVGHDFRLHCVIGDHNYYSKYCWHAQLWKQTKVAPVKQKFTGTRLQRVLSAIICLSWVVHVGREASAIRVDLLNGSCFRMCCLQMFCSPRMNSRELHKLCFY